MKSTTIIVLLTVLAFPASAQDARTFHDSAGRVTGSARTDAKRCDETLRRDGAHDRHEDTNRGGEHVRHPFRAFEDVPVRLHVIHQLISMDADCGARRVREG